MTTATHVLAADTCVVRDTASRKGRTRSVAPGVSPMRFLHYGRVVLDGGAEPVQFQRHFQHSRQRTKTFAANEVGLLNSELGRGVGFARNHGNHGRVATVIRHVAVFDIARLGDALYCIEAR